MLSSIKSKLRNKRTRSLFLEKINLYIFPILLGAVICFAIINTLHQELAILYTTIFFLFEWILFRFFDNLKLKKKFGGIIYTVILAILFFISIYLMSQGSLQLHNWKAPILWFFGETSEDSYLFFLNSVFIIGGFFIISILYYFTQIRFRSLGIMLCILFPFVIYARRSAIMPEPMITIIVVLYLATIIHNRNTDPSQPNRKRIFLKFDRSYLLSIIIFVSVTGTITMLLPKPTYTSKLEQNSNYFSAYTTALNTDGGTSSDSISQNSSPRYGARNYNGTPLFYFSTNGTKEVYYLRKQSFITFNGDVWQTMDYNSNNLIFSRSNLEYSTDDILNDMQQLLSESNIQPQSYINLKNGRVYSDTFIPPYLPAPFGTITENANNNKVRYINLSQITIYRRVYQSQDAILNDTFEFYDQDRNLYEYARQIGMDSESYLQFLSYNRSDAADRLIDDYLHSLETYSDQSNISEKVSALAKEITQDYDSDIQKAIALEQYFEKNDYLYDEDYIPEDQSIDYFIFEGKTGVCTNYATAMTLMARSIGLPARYVEGFAAFEKTDDDVFLIRDSYAHAFVEIYIPGAGWLTFDPTVSGYQQIPQDDNNFFYELFTLIVNRFFIIILVAVFILLLLLRDRIEECIFRIRQIFRDPKQKTLQLYANVIKLVSFSCHRDCSSYTVNMLREYLHSQRHHVPEQLLQLFERTAFGGYEPTLSEYQSAYTEYKHCYKYLRKIPSKKTKTKI